MWTVFVVTIIYVVIGFVAFIFGQIFLQKKIEKKTDIGYRNYGQAELLIEIGTWKSVWDDHQNQEREAFIHKGGGNDPEIAKEEVK